jgi:hypothetical protein
VTALWSIRPCIVCGTAIKCEPAYPDDVRVVCAWCIAREVTDDTLGLGAYADVNRGNPDPHVQRQVVISDRDRRSITGHGTDSTTAQ